MIRFASLNMTGTSPAECADTLSREIEHLNPNVAILLEAGNGTQTPEQIDKNSRVLRALGFASVHTTAYYADHPDLQYYLSMATCESTDMRTEQYGSRYGIRVDMDKLAVAAVHHSDMSGGIRGVEAQCVAESLACADQALVFGQSNELAVGLVRHLTRPVIAKIERRQAARELPSNYLHDVLSDESRTGDRLNPESFRDTSELKSRLQRLFGATGGIALEVYRNAGYTIPSRLTPTMRALPGVRQAVLSIGLSAGRGLARHEVSTQPSKASSIHRWLVSDIEL